MSHAVTSKRVYSDVSLVDISITAWTFIAVWINQICITVWNHQVRSSSTIMGWLWLVGSLKIYASFAEYSLFYRALLQQRPVSLRSLLIVATPYHSSPYEIISVNLAMWICQCEVMNNVKLSSSYEIINVNLSMLICQCEIISVKLSSSYEMMVHHCLKWSTLSILSSLVLEGIEQ